MEEKMVILNEVCVPGTGEIDFDNGTMEEICPDCGELKKDCKCKDK